MLRGRILPSKTFRFGGKEIRGKQMLKIESDDGQQRLTHPRINELLPLFDPLQELIASFHGEPESRSTP